MLRRTLSRRVFAVFLALTLAISLFVGGGAQKAQAYSTLDQWIQSYTGYYYINGNQWVAQSFKPTKNKLDGFGMYGGIYDSWLAPSSCYVNYDIYKYPEMTHLAGGTMTMNKPQTWHSQTISPAITTVPGSSYIVYLNASSSYAYWRFNGNNIYSRGNSVVNSSADINKDFLFATWGYNDVPPAQPDPAPAPAQPE